MNMGTHTHTHLLTYIHQYGYTHTHEKNTKVVNETINNMKHLWEFKSSDSNKKTSIKENEDAFFKMMNKVRGK